MTKSGLPFSMNLTSSHLLKVNNVSQRTTKTKYLKTISTDYLVLFLVKVRKSHAKCGLAARDSWCSSQKWDSCSRQLDRSFCTHGAIIRVMFFCTNATRPGVVRDENFLMLWRFWLNFGASGHVFIRNDANWQLKVWWVPRLNFGFLYPTNTTSLTMMTRVRQALVKGNLWVWQQPQTSKIRLRIAKTSVPCSRDGSK